MRERLFCMCDDKGRRAGQPRPYGKMMCGVGDGLRTSLVLLIYDVREKGASRTPHPTACKQIPKK